MTGAEAGRAIREDKAELALLPGPGKLLRALIDRFPRFGTAINRATGTTKTMRTVAEHRERGARLAEAEQARERRAANDPARVTQHAHGVIPKPDHMARKRLTTASDGPSTRVRALQLDWLSGDSVAVGDQEAALPSPRTSTSVSAAPAVPSGSSAGL